MHLAFRLLHHSFYNRQPQLLMKFKFSTVAKRGTVLNLKRGDKIEINCNKVGSKGKKITPAVKKGNEMDGEGFCLTPGKTKPFVLIFSISMTTIYNFRPYASSFLTVLS